MLRTDPTRWHAPSALETVRAEVIARCHERGLELFDGECVRLADIDLVQPCGYIDSLVTNRSAHDARVRPFGYDDAGRLLSLRRSRFANTLGAAVFVRCGDAVLLQRQPDNSVVSCGLWAPSGSGSSDPEDVRETLAATFEATARRELAEESGLDLEVRFVAWRRNPDAAGKPEGMCEAWVNEHLDVDDERFVWMRLDEASALERDQVSSPLAWWIATIS